jgi:uncharacterized metal-binding protein
MKPCRNVSKGEVMPDAVNPSPACAACKLPISKKICFNAQGSGPDGCPTLHRRELLARARETYSAAGICSFAREASRQEAHGYANRHERPYILQPSKTRMVEICEFAGKMGYTRLGLAFCLGLSREAAQVELILKARRFDVVSVACKAGRVPKEAIGITDEDKIFQGSDEAMCNPVFQALLLNDARTDFNVLLGLCVGHDSLFFKYAEAPTTVLAVKDRVTGHNPLAAVYLAPSYYRKMLQEEKTAPEK